LKLNPEDEEWIGSFQLDIDFEAWVLCFDFKFWVWSWKSNLKSDFEGWCQSLKFKFKVKDSTWSFRIKFQFKFFVKGQLEV